MRAFNELKWDENVTETEDFSVCISISTCLIGAARAGALQKRAESARTALAHPRFSVTEQGLGVEIFHIKVAFFRGFFQQARPDVNRLESSIPSPGHLGLVKGKRFSFPAIPSSSHSTPPWGYWIYGIFEVNISPLTPRTVCAFTESKAKAKDLGTAKWDQPGATQSRVLV